MPTPAPGKQKPSNICLTIVAVFNILACIGWSSVNVIVGAQLLNAVNRGIPGYAGIIIIAAATFIVTLFGYKVVHAYEYWSWIPCFIIFLIVLGEFAHSGTFNNIPMGVGNSEAGSILSFAATVFGFGTGWTSYAADYTVYQPVNSSRVKIFAWTYAGLILPLCFTEMLGLAVGTAMVNTPSYADAYTESHIGGLLAAVLFPPLGRFGQFCLVVLALSIVANNCPNIYSLTFSLQVMGRWTQAVPRFIWTFIGTLVYCAIAIPGYSNFEAVLENFMLLIVRPFAPPFSSAQNLLSYLPLNPPPSPTSLYETFPKPNSQAHPTPSSTLLKKKRSTGLLARHLRRHRPNRTLPLQTRLLRLRPHNLQLPRQITPRHRRHGRLLLRHLRRRHGHGAGVVRRPHRREDRNPRVRRRFGVPVGVCVCGD